MLIARSFQASRLLTIILVFIMSAGLALAQPGRGRGMMIKAEGSVVDSKTNEPLVGAAVKVTSADGGTGTFGICDTEGNFSFEVNRPGKYTLEVTYVGYKMLTKDVSLFPGRGAKIGTLKLQEDPKQLAEVETVGRNQRLKQVGDTIVYNADAYKVADGATAEDLVAKMPGIEVTDTGVKAQGETVEKVLVDGKSFFENDPKLALRTLPAEVVQSVSVFDKQSDQAEFTGFDDGNTVKAMDLATKSYRRNGIFGRVYGGLGSNFDFDQGYWNTGFNLNFFEANRRISLLGMSNNVNQQNFTFDDLQSSGGMGGGFRGGMGNRMGSMDGVSRANAIGMNYSNSYLDDKLEVQGSYFFNQLRTQLSDSTFDDYINTERASIAQQNRVSHNYSHRADMHITYRPNDKNQLIFRPSINFQTTDADGFNTNTTWKLPLSTVMDDSFRRSDITRMQSSSDTRSISDNSSWNVGGSLVWRHRFDKQGRTLSAGFDGQVSGSTTDADYIKRINWSNPYYQRQNADTKNYNWGGNVQWTENIADNQQLSLRYNLNFQKSTRDNMVSYYDDEDFHRIKTDTLQMGYDGANTSKYIQRNLRQGGEIAWRLHTTHYNANVGVNFQNSHLEGEQDYYLQPTLSIDPTKKNYFSVLPNVRLEWRSDNGSQIELRYRASSSNPSVSNLQQSVNTSNELNYSTGNPDLDQSIGHNLSLRFIHSNMETATNFMVFGQYSARQDYIGRQYLTNNSNERVSLQEAGRDFGYGGEQFNGLSLAAGAKISRPVNMSGNQSARLGLVYGFPFDLIYSNVNLSLDGSFSTTPSQQLYYDINSSTGVGHVTDLTTKVLQWGFGPRLHVSSNISTDLDFTLMYQPSFQWVKDTENKANSYNYVTHRADARLNWTFWHGFTTEQSLGYVYYGGSAMTSSEDEWIWNMSFGKKFLKGNKAEVKLQAYDVLGSRTGYRQSVSDSYIRASYTNFMPRYFLLTFTYKLSSYKGSGGSAERRGGRGGFGGPGGPGGFGGPGGGRF